MIYKTSGTCSQAIEVEVENDIITKVKFYGGCSGNTQGVAALVVGMNAREAVAKLKGIRCGFRSTSCPDQLAKAIESIIG